MSIGLRVDTSGIEGLVERINRLGRAERAALMGDLAAEGESQTRRRIQEEKTAPDGTPWAAWSPAYARGRHGGQSLLQGEGDLLDSMTSGAGDDYAEWGSNLIYAAIHQEGGTPDMPAGPAGIPAREYLGLSDENLADMDGIVENWLDDHMRRLQR
ncbi:MAG: phage virion morphogenesis protein [Aquisalimonadaceae bacterium]